MIKIWFPPGCYGTYLARCVYNFTNLRKQPFQNFVFDPAGSSHPHRLDKDAAWDITVSHIDSINKPNAEKHITILPVASCELDYFNNQYTKEPNFSLADYINKETLAAGWNCHARTPAEVPRWVLREFFSLWIDNFLTTAYNKDVYKKLPSDYICTTDDVINNLPKVIDDICHALKLTLTVTESVIEQNHVNFLSAQHFIGHQARIDNWVDQILTAHAEHANPCQTIFDECWIQHRLRTHGWEIECHALNELPSTSSDFRKIIYRV